MKAVDQLASLVGVLTACAALAISRATFCRRQSCRAPDPWATWCWCSQSVGSCVSAMAFQIIVLCTAPNQGC